MARADASARRRPGEPTALLPPVPTLPGLLSRLALLEGALAVAGFTRTSAWIERHAAAAPSRDRDRLAVDGWVARVERAVATAAALFPGRAECLERSLLLYWLLRRRGVRCELRLGVQLYPFLAHAWVERDGVVLNDVPEHVAQFAPLQGVAP